MLSAHLFLRVVLNPNSPVIIHNHSSHAFFRYCLHRPSTAPPTCAPLMASPCPLSTLFRPPLLATPSTRLAVFRRMRRNRNRSG